MLLETFLEFSVGAAYDDPDGNTVPDLATSQGDMCSFHCPRPEDNFTGVKSTRNVKDDFGVFTLGHVNSFRTF